MASNKILGKKMSAIDEAMRGAVKVVDECDPIYDSESEGEDCFYTVIDVAADEHRQALNQTSIFSEGSSAPAKRAPISFDTFMKVARAALEEYSNTQETSKLAKTLQELQCPHFLDSFAALAIRVALDRSREEQKNISASLTLLADQKIITKQQLLRAFEKLVQSADDLDLDVPGAADRVHLFLECACLDGCVDADYAKRLPEKFLVALSPATLASNPALQTRLAEVKAFKEAVRDFLLDFFDSGNPDDAADFLRKQQQPLLQHEFVKLLVEASLAKDNTQREMVSNALDHLYGKILHPDDIQLGFARLVGAIDDIALDNPAAYDLLSKFLARAVADEILPPSFLADRFRLHYGGAGGMRVLKKVQKWMSRQNAIAARMRKVWTGTDPDKKETTEFKEKVRECLYEYFEVLDLPDCVQRLENLEPSPDQAAELVRKVLVVCMEKAATGTSSGNAETAAFKLLRELLKHAYIDEEMIYKGFDQARNLIAEIKLDIPDVETQLPKLVEVACLQGMLPADF